MVSVACGPVLRAKWFAHIWRRLSRASSKKAKHDRGEALTRMRRKTRGEEQGFVLLLWAVFCSCAPNASLAETALIEEGRSCAALTDDAERLACFDAISVFRSGTAFKTSTAAHAQALDRLGSKYLDSGQSSDAHYDYPLLKMSKNRRGLWVFELANGQIWRQLEAGRMAKPKAYPAEVRISQQSMGSHALRILPKGKSVKVRRMR